MKRKVLWGLAAGILLTVGLGYFELRRLGLTSASDELAQQIQMAAKDGLPLMPNDLRKNPVPDADNAANLIKNAYLTASTLPSLPLKVNDSWRFSYITPKPSEAQVRQALKDLAPVLKQVEGVTACSGLDFHYRWELGPNLLLPEFAQIKSFVRAFETRAEFEWADGRRAQATHSLVVAAHLTRLSGQSPTLISFFVQTGLESGLLQIAGDFIRKSSGAPEALACGWAVLKELGPMPDVRVGLGGEVVMLRIAIRTMPFYEDPVSSDVDNSEWKLLRYRPIADLNEAHALQILRDEFQAAPKKPEDFARSFRESLRIRQAADALNNVASIVAPMAVFSTTDRLATAMATRWVFQAGIEILEEKNKTGRFPSQWKKVRRDLYDPFMNQPLSYRLTPDGFVVYSFGKDRKDDGGRPYALDGDSSQRRDISFEYPHRSIRPVKAVLPGPPGSD